MFQASPADDLACYEEELSWCMDEQEADGPLLPPQPFTRTLGSMGMGVGLGMGNVCSPMLLDISPSCHEQLDCSPRPASPLQLIPPGPIARSRSLFDARAQVLPLTRPSASASASASVPSSSAPLPSMPPGLRRCRSVGVRGGSSLSAVYRESAGRFYSSQQLRKLDEGGLKELAEVVSNMHNKERNTYALDATYINWLNSEPQVQNWRRGAVRWCIKVVEHFKVNREIVWSTLNNVDRFLGAEPKFAAGRTQFEQVVLRALLLACKIQQAAAVLPLSHLAPMSSVPLDSRASCDLELRMSKALGWCLTPPTPGAVIHHLLSFLPDQDPRSLLALDERANDLAMLALEGPEFLRYSVSAIAAAAVQVAISELCDVAGRSLIGPRWIDAMDRHGVPVRGKEVDACIGLLRGAMGHDCDHDYDDEEAEMQGIGMGMGMGFRDDGCGPFHPPVTSLYLPDYLAEADREASGFVGADAAGCGRPRSESPTGVDDVFMVEMETMRRMHTHTHHAQLHQMQPPIHVQAQAHGQAGQADLCFKPKARAATPGGCGFPMQGAM